MVSNPLGILPLFRLPGVHTVRTEFLELRLCLEWFREARECGFRESDGLGKVRRRRLHCSRCSWSRAEPSTAEISIPASWMDQPRPSEHSVGTKTGLEEHGSSSAQSSCPGRLDRTRWDGWDVRLPLAKENLTNTSVLMFRNSDDRLQRCSSSDSVRKGGKEEGKDLSGGDQIVQGSDFNFRMDEDYLLDCFFLFGMYSCCLGFMFRRF